MFWKNNIVIFNQELFLQQHGVAMGMRLAPVLTSLFLSLIEEKYITTSPVKPTIFKRYIVIFLLYAWEDNRATLDHFISSLNCIKPQLKFTTTISTSSVTFLDLIIHKGSDFNITGSFQTEISYKATNNFPYIHG